MIPREEELQAEGRGIIVQYSVIPQSELPTFTSRDRQEEIGLDRSGQDSFSTQKSSYSIKRGECNVRP